MSGTACRAWSWILQIKPAERVPCAWLNQRETARWNKITKHAPLWDVKEKLQVGFIVYGSHKPAAWHLTRQERNASMFENSPDLIQVFSLHVLFITHFCVCGKQVVSCESSLLGLWKLGSHGMYWGRINLWWFWFTSVCAEWWADGFLNSWMLFPFWYCRWWTACTCWYLIY